MKVQVVIDGEVYEVEVEDTGDDSAALTVTEEIQSVVLPAPGSGAQVADPKIYRSPVAGLVARINVAPGNEVRANEVLLVLEAMKMETSMMATTAGTVKAVHVKAGDAVKIDQVLLEFE